MAAEHRQAGIAAAARAMFLAETPPTPGQPNPAAEWDLGMLPAAVTLWTGRARTAYDTIAPQARALMAAELGLPDPVPAQWLHDHTRCLSEAEHRTTAGWTHHRYCHEPVCDDCRRAREAYMTAYHARRREDARGVS